MAQPNRLCYKRKLCVSPNYYTYLLTHNLFMNWRLKLFNLIPNFLKRIGCQLLRRFGYDPDAWLENFLKEHKGD